MFAIRNKMIYIPSNFSSSSEKIECLCGEIENMEHVYKCEKEVELPYEKVYNGNIKEQSEILRIFEKQLDRRKTKLDELELPCDPNVIR